MEKETTTTLTKFEDIPCCPEFDKCPPCDVLDMRRRLSFPTSVRTDSGQPDRRGHPSYTILALFRAARPRRYRVHDHAAAGRKGATRNDGPPQPLQFRQRKQP